MKKRWKRCLPVLILWLVFVSGCGEKENGSPAGTENGTEAVSEDTAGAESQSPQQTASEETDSKEAVANAADDDVGQMHFEAQDMDGNIVSEAVFSNAKLTMVNVWATYCDPCLREMPGLGQLAGSYDASEFQLIGIISDVQEGAKQDKLDLAADLITQTGADYMHLLLNEAVYNSLLTDVMAVPTTFFVNEKGEILDTVVGAMEKFVWEEKINALLDEM